MRYIDNYETGERERQSETKTKIDQVQSDTDYREREIEEDYTSSIMNFFLVIYIINYDFFCEKLNVSIP